MNSKITVRKALLLGATFVTVGVAAESSAKAAVYDNQAPQARKVGFYKPQRNNMQADAAATSFDSLRHNVLMATTQAVGEEEARPPTSDPGRVTTMMVGEEEAKPPVVKPPVTPPGDGHATTMMVGEEDVKPPREPIDPFHPKDPNVTPPYHPDDSGFHPKDPVNDGPGFHPDDTDLRPRDHDDKENDKDKDKDKGKHGHYEYNWDHKTTEWVPDPGYEGTGPKDTKKIDDKDGDKPKHPDDKGFRPKDRDRPFHPDDTGMRPADRGKPAFHPDDSGFKPYIPKHVDDSGMRPYQPTPYKPKPKTADPKPYQPQTEYTMVPKTNNDAVTNRGTVPQTLWTQQIRGNTQKKPALGNPTVTTEHTNTND